MGPGAVQGQEGAPASRAPAPRGKCCRTQRWGARRGGVLGVHRCSRASGCEGRRIAPRSSHRCIVQAWTTPIISAGWPWLRTRVCRVSTSRRGSEEDMGLASRCGECRPGSGALSPNPVAGGDTGVGVRRHPVRGGATRGWVSVASHDHRTSSPGPRDATHGAPCTPRGSWSLLALRCSSRVVPGTTTRTTATKTAALEPSPASTEGIGAPTFFVTRVRGGRVAVHVRGVVLWRLLGPRARQRGGPAVGGQVGHPSLRPVRGASGHGGRSG